MSPDYTRAICPELPRAGSAAAQDAVIKETLRAERKSWRRQVRGTLLVLLWALGGLTFLEVEPRVRGYVPPGISYPAYFLILAPLAILGISWCVDRRSRRRALRRALRSSGIPICECCGYDLTGLITATCPECGTRDEPGPSRQIGTGTYYS